MLPIYRNTVFLNLPKFELKCLNLPNLIEVVKVYTNDSNFTQMWIKLFLFTQTFLNVLQF